MSYLYSLIILGVICFQVALIFGAPWGRYTQGGQIEDALPQKGRIIAGASIVILAALALAILSADGKWPHWPAWTGWVAVVVNAIVTVLNWITPSAVERKLWGPITTVMLIVAIAVVWW
ncbi:MAG: hypothetical protein OXQ92_17000 [Boseongicola sp.]|nr:hypothetical protein [Boseongicola sp.]MDD9977935.1 hypothetical protein [Boseongicola sp.]